MNIPFMNFKLNEDRKYVCGECGSDSIQQKVSTGNFVGAWFHCSNYNCMQSYSYERNRYYQKINDLEKEIEELRNDREE